MNKTGPRHQVYWSAILLAGIPLLYFPALIYRDNAGFLDASFASVLVMLFPTFLLLTLLLSAPSAFLKAKSIELYRAVLISLAFLAWISGNFFFGQRGVLDGQTPLREDSLAYQRSELAAFSMGFLLLVYLARKLSKAPGMAVMIMNLMMAGLVGLTLLSETKSYSTSRNHESFYQLSSEKNVLIFIFDTFQSDFFASVLKKSPSVAQEFEGFTFFSENVGVAPTTYLSLPAIHSGIEYSENLTLPAFYQDAIRKNSFLSKLAQAGYNSSLVRPPKTCPEGVSCFSPSLMSEGWWGQARHDYLFLIDLSLYRVSPSYFKHFIYDSGKWFLLQAVLKSNHALRENAILQKFAEKVTSRQQIPCARFIHLYNTHPPAEVDSRCKPLQKPKWNKLAAENQAACAVSAFVDLLNRLKEQNLYDNSLIAIAGDHGAAISYGGRPSIMSRARPLLLIKPFGQRGKLHVSRAKTSLTDLAATICKLTGDCESNTGKSVFEIKVEEKRRNLFYEYTWRNEYWGREKIPIENSWIILGPANDILSWHKKIRTEDLRQLSFEFNTNDEQEAYGLGWAAIKEHDGRSVRWIDRAFAQLYLPLKTQIDGRMKASLLSDVDGSVTLYLDDTLLQEINLMQGWNELNVELPGSLVSQQPARLTFIFSYSNSADRRLMVAFDRLAVEYD